METDTWHTREEMQNELVTRAGDSVKGLHLIPLPGGKSNVWKYYGLCSEDGLSILPQHSSRVFCMVPGCPNPEMVYCGNTTNLYGHLQRKHPEIALPEKLVSNRPRCVKMKRPHPFVPKKYARLNRTSAQKYARKVRRMMTKAEELEEEEQNGEISIVATITPDQHYEDQQNMAQHQYTLSNALSVDFHEGTDDIVLVNDISQGELSSTPIVTCVEERREVTRNMFTQTGESTDVEIIPVPGLNTEHVTEALLDLMVSDMAGDQLVQRPGFQAFVNTLFPRYELPTTEETQSLLKSRHDSCKAALRKKLHLVKQLAVSINQWKSKCDSKRYMTVSVSYIDTDWVLSNRVLATVNSEYGGDEQLRNVLAEYNFSPHEVVSVTSNESLRFQEDFLQLPCLEAVLDEALQSGFEHDSIEQLQKLFLSSSIMSTNENPKSKWTSIFQILSNVVRASSELDSAAREAHTVLGNILKIMNLLHEETTWSASNVIPLLAQICNLYLNSSGNSNIHKMKTEVGNRLQKSFQDPSRARLLEKCTILDPRFKDCDVFHNKPVLRKEILDEMQLQIEVSGIDYVSDSNQFMQELFQSLPKLSKSPEQQLSSELEFYLNCQSVGYDENPLRWWKNNSVHFPTLSVLAQKYLAVPIMVKKSRNASFLSHPDAETLLFLNSNMDLIRNRANCHKTSHAEPNE